MLYVVAVELIPAITAGPASQAGTVAAAAGFLLMMIMDVALG